MICICSSDHLIILLGMRKIDSLRSFDYPPWDEENVNLDEANSNTCMSISGCHHYLYFSMEIKQTRTLRR